MGLTTAIKTAERDRSQRPTPEVVASHHVASFGEMLRQARRGRFTLEELAHRAGVSVGLISQIERGNGNPSLVTLIKLAHALDIQLEDLFQGPPGARQMLVTKSDRARLELPHEGHEGLVYELLTPDLNRKIGMTRAQIPSGWDNEQEPYSRPGEHCLHLLDGELDATIAGEFFHLRAGDTLTFDSSLPHWYRNSSSRPAHIITAMTPPHGLAATGRTNGARSRPVAPTGRATPRAKPVKRRA
jgi:transcriptional regulator with XRE-family HTH domain